MRHLPSEPMQPMRPPPDLPPGRPRLGVGARIVLWSTAGIIGFFGLIALIGVAADRGDSTDQPAASSASPAVSSMCANAFETAASIEGLGADNELRATLTACRDYDEWLAGLRNNPAALGLTDRAVIEGPMEVANFCHSGDGRVCDDARERGILNADGTWND